MGMACLQRVTRWATVADSETGMRGAEGDEVRTRTRICECLCPRTCRAHKVLDCLFVTLFVVATAGAHAGPGPSQSTLHTVAVHVADDRARPHALPLLPHHARLLPPGAITTLGRGGSDLTATVLGAALELPEVQVWKDVDGERGLDGKIRF